MLILATLIIHGSFMAMELWKTAWLSKLMSSKKILFKPIQMYNGLFTVLSFSFSFSPQSDGNKDMQMAVDRSHISHVYYSLCSFSPLKMIALIWFWISFLTTCDDARLHSEAGLSIFFLNISIIIAP